MPTALRVTPWPDPVLDVLGHDPRSWYAETFWLPTLGPTALLLMRHLADRFERTPDAVELPVADTAAALGLGPREGNSSPLMRSLTRLQQFELAAAENETTIAVRRALPPVHRRHVRRLPTALQARHEEWIASQSAAPVESRAGGRGASRSRSSRRANRSTASNARCTAAASTPRSRTKPCAGRASAASSSTTSPIPPPEHEPGAERRPGWMHCVRR